MTLEDAITILLEAHLGPDWRDDEKWQWEIPVGTLPVPTIDDKDAYFKAWEAVRTRIKIWETVHAYGKSWETIRTCLKQDDHDPDGY